MSDTLDKPVARRRAASLYALGAKLLLAILMPLALLAATDGILRWANFGRNLDLFIPYGPPGTYRTNPYFTALFFPPSFGLKVENFQIVRRKPPGTFRVFVLGGSAADGVPVPGFGLAAQIRAQLSGRIPGKKVEVYNLAVTALDSAGVRRILREALPFHPDLFVIYMGNNEVVGPYGPGSAVNNHLFSAPVVQLSVALRATRLGQAIEALASRLEPSTRAKLEWRGLEMFSGHTIAATDPRMRRVYDNFRSNLNHMLAAANRAHVKVALCTMAVNIKDCSPFASLHRPGFRGQIRRGWQDATHRAALALAGDDAAAAEAPLQRALQLDPDYAATHYSLGRVYDALGRPAAAAREYREALQLDGLRFRADAEINRIIREQARRHGVMLVDVAKALGTEPSATGAVAGSSLFLEHVHFTWRGNCRLGALVAAHVLRAVHSAFAPRSEPAVAAAIGYTEYGRLELLTLTEQVTKRPPFTSQPTYAEDRARRLQEIRDTNKRLSAPGMLRQCARRIREATERLPGVAFTYFHLASIDLWLREPEAALRANDEVLKLEPPSPENQVQRAYILYALGRSDEAVSALRRSITAYPYYYESYSVLAHVWEELGRTATGVAYFRSALKSLPSTRIIHELLGQLLLEAKDKKGAERQWRAAVALTPDSENALVPLTKLLFSEDRNDQAFALLQRAFRYNPRNFTVDSLLAQFAEQRGDTREQAEALDALTKSGPVAPQVYLKAGRLLASLGRRQEAELLLLRARTHARRGGAAQVADRATAALQHLRGS